MGLFSKKCYRCQQRKASLDFEGVPTCAECSKAIQATREEVRHCPIDGNGLQKQVLHGVIVDRCSSCGGVWLDGGELELVQKALAAGGGGDFTSGFFLGMATG